jgi:hypothetical protein
MNQSIIKTPLPDAGVYPHKSDQGNVGYRDPSDTGIGVFYILQIPLYMIPKE